MRKLDRRARRAFGMRWGRRAGLVCVGVLMISSSLVTEAFATFGSAPTPPTMSVSSATLAAPTGLSATVDCQLIVLLPQVHLNWTATTSSFATGYQVFRSGSSGGPYSLVSTITGIATTSFLNTGLALGGTYYYVVKATKGNWTSANSSQIGVTAPAICL